MKRRLQTPALMPGRDFERQALAILQRVQQDLMPEHASEIIAINVETGEYVLGRTAHEAGEAFRQRWPDQLFFMIRVDGGPVIKFHGK